MKKSLVAACAALACISAANAQSSVTLSGLADVYIGSIRMAGAPGRTGVVDSGGMTTSWFGFKGTEDLGGGLKANFKLTSFQRMDSGSPGRFTGDTFFSRDANVGLSGGFGSFSLGRDLAPNFLPMILFNPFGDSFTFSPLVLHKITTTPSDTGWSNEMIYTTPSIGGLVANLHYQFGEQNSSTGNGGKKNVGVNALWGSGPLALTGYYEHDQLSNPVPSLFVVGGIPETRKDWMLGASYDANVVKGFLTYGETKADVSATKTKMTSLGASAPIGAGKILAAVAHSKFEGVAGTPSRTTATIGYDYFLSKRTDLYANFMVDRFTGVRNGNSFGTGIRHRF